MLNQQYLPGIGNLFKRTLQVYKDRFRILGGLILILAFVYFISNAADYLVKLIENPFIALILSLVIIAFSIITWIIFCWISIAVIYAVKDREENIGVKESLKRGWPKILPVIWISILFWFIYLGGSLLLIIPGIIFAIWFNFAGMIVIAEDARGMNALLKSKEYVKGNWWPVAGRIAIALILWISATLIFAVILGFASALLNISIVTLLGNFVVAIFSLLLTVLYLTYSFLLYEDLKKLRADLVFAPKKNEKTLFSVVGVLGILAAIAVPVALVYFIFSSEEYKDIFISLFYKNYIPEETIPEGSGVNFQDFKKYTSEQYGFEIWYPKTWFVRAGYGNIINQVDMPGDFYLFGDNISKIFFIRVVPAPAQSVTELSNDILLEDYGWLPSGTVEAKMYHNPFKILFTDYDVYHVKIESSCDNDRTFLIKDGYMYIFVGCLEDKDVGKIVSTFKFVQ